MKWETVKLGEVAEIFSGATPKSSVAEYWDGDIAWVTPKDLSNLTTKEIGSTERAISEAGYKSCSTRMLPPYSVLFSSRAPIGLVAINTIPICTNQGFKSFVPDCQELFPDFLYWWLKLNRQKLEHSGRGATFKEVSKTIVSNFEIPLPPLEQQKRIAAILDAADALRVKRRAVLEQLDELVQSVFLEMFGDPVTNPKSWELLEIGTLGEVITGNTPSRKKSEFYGNEIEWIKSDNINTPSFILTEAEESLSTLGKEVARLAPKESILVTCIAGSPSSIGNAAVSDREVAFNQQINAFVPNTQIHFWYAFGVFLVGKSLVQRASTNSMKGMVSKSAFSKILFPVPTKSLQCRFAEIVSAIEAQKARVRGHLAELDTLFASLQQRAFNGEL